MSVVSLHSGRRLADRAFIAACGACAVVACGVLLALAGVIVARALPALDGELIVAASRGAGAAGGLRYQILGTLILAATTLATALPPALALALAREVYLRPAAARRLGLALTTFNGVPSILFGLFGLMVFSRWLGWGKSWLAGGVILGLMILPAVTVSLSERIAALPRSYLQAAAGLGLTRSQVVTSVILPQSVGGLVSGVLLGLARAAGETAPILFTAAVFSGATLPDGIRESPVLALPYHIFTLAQDSLAPGSESRLWGAALVLLALVFAMSLAALPARLAIRQEAHDA